MKKCRNQTNFFPFVYLLLMRIAHAICVDVSSNLNLLSKRHSSSKKLPMNWYTKRNGQKALKQNQKCFKYWKGQNRIVAEWNYHKYFANRPNLLSNVTDLFEARAACVSMIFDYVNYSLPSFFEVINIWSMRKLNIDKWNSLTL